MLGTKRGNDKTLQRPRRRERANEGRTRGGQRIKTKVSRNDTRKLAGSRGRRRECSGPMLSTGTVPVLKDSGGVEEKRGRYTNDV